MNTDLENGMRVKKKSDGIMTLNVFHFIGYDEEKGTAPDGSKYAKLFELRTFQNHTVPTSDLRLLMFETPSGRRGGRKKTRKTRKGRKSRKSRKTKISRKSRKTKRSRRVH